MRAMAILMMVLATVLAAEAQQKPASAFMPPLGDADLQQPSVVEVEETVCLTAADLIFLFPRRWAQFTELPCGIPKSRYLRMKERRQEQIEFQRVMRWAA